MKLASHTIEATTDVSAVVTGWSEYVTAFENVYGTPTNDNTDAHRKWDAAFGEGTLPNAVVAVTHAPGMKYAEYRMALERY